MGWAGRRAEAAAGREAGRQGGEHPGGGKSVGVRGDRGAPAGKPGTLGGEWLVRDSDRGRKP